MSKYSSSPVVRTASRMAHVPDTRNLAGGQAHSQNAQLELASIVLTSFLKDQFYRTETQVVTRLNELFTKVPATFIARLAIFARHEYGMRSVSHYCAAWIGRNVHGEKWLRPFFRSVARRPDDVLEILSCYIANNPEVAPVMVKSGSTLAEAKIKVQRLRLPNAMKRGLGDYLAQLSEHALAKYRKDAADLSMIDAVNLCHPKHSEALAKLIKGTLPTADTWETAITAAGQSEDPEVDTATAKGAEWDRLLNEKKLGYFALLRNIRNICEHGTNPEAELCRQLVDAAAIKKSLVLPFRFLAAMEAMSSLKPRQVTMLMPAMSDAVELALANVPELPGRTLVALDDSGSMAQVWKKGVLLAAAIVKRNDADLITFADSAKYQAVNRRNPLLTIAQNIPYKSGGTNFHDIFEVADSAKYQAVNRRNPLLTIAQNIPYKSGGTNFHDIFEVAAGAKEKYDRVIILSDMQGWIGAATPRGAFNHYKTATGCNPRIFSIDLAGYGTMQFPEDGVFCVAGFSEKIFDTIRLLEGDRNALINQINAVEI